MKIWLVFKVIFTMGTYFTTEGHILKSTNDFRHYFDGILPPPTFPTVFEVLKGWYTKGCIFSTLSPEILQYILLKNKTPIITPLNKQCELAGCTSRITSPSFDITKGILCTDNSYMTCLECRKKVCMMHYSWSIAKCLLCKYGAPCDKYVYDKKGFLRYKKDTDRKRGFRLPYNPGIPLIKSVIRV